MDPEPIAANNVEKTHPQKAAAWSLLHQWPHLAAVSDLSFGFLVEYALILTCCACRSLENHGLTSIPKEIGNLSSLVQLHVAFSYIMEPGEDYNSVLTSFHCRSLSNNQLTSIPAETGNLASINFMYVDNN